jgi:hypothetical protein
LIDLRIANMGRGKMDEAAAARIRKARGEKVRHTFSNIRLVDRCLRQHRMLLQKGLQLLLERIKKILPGGVGNLVRVEVGANKATAIKLNENNLQAFWFYGEVVCPACFIPERAAWRQPAFEEVKVGRGYKWKRM